MFASNGTQETIHYFLRLVQQQSPEVVPQYIISDFDHAQINACLAVYPQCWVLLCWWHVLHAWQQHFRISENTELWERLKRWVRIEAQDDFNAAWDWIQVNAPPGFNNYLKQYWMPEHIRKMWSAVYRTGRSIFEQSDTNMLIESYESISFFRCSGAHPLAASIMS